VCALVLFKTLLQYYRYKNAENLRQSASQSWIKSRRYGDLHARERTILSGRRLSAKLVPNFADRRCHVVSVTDPLQPYSRFLDELLLFLQLYSRGWVLYSAYNHKRATAAKCRESHHRGTDCTLAIGERHSSSCIRFAVVWLTSFCGGGALMIVCTVYVLYTAFS
jgi:hypothetical protein